MWYNKKLFKVSATTLVILLCVYMAIQILPFFTEFLGLLSSLFFSVTIAIVVYYVVRPLRDFLEQKNVPRLATILLIFTLLAFFIALAITFIWPFLSQQINEFTDMPREKLKHVESKTMDILNAFNFTSLNEAQLQEYLVFYTKEVMLYIVNNIAFTLTSIAHVASNFIVTPFILFYLLKDDYGMFSIDSMPQIKDEASTERILDNIDKTLAKYIEGQVLVACLVGSLIFVGYFFIGLNYALPLALLVFLFNLIPFCGPIISTIPAFLIGMSESPAMGAKVLSVVMGVHLLDMNLISPRIVGHSLNIHPVTIIMLLVVGFSFGGIIGLFLITPLYAVCKSIAKDVREINAAEDKELIPLNVN